MKNLLLILVLFISTLSQAQIVQKIESTHWSKEVPRTYTVLVTENPFTYHSIAWILPEKEEIILKENIVRTEIRDNMKVFHISTIEKEEVHGYTITLDSGHIFRTTSFVSIGERVNWSIVKDE